MKIYCEKCHEDISADCDILFEKSTVGNVQCPKCKKVQSRYVSEGDLLLYFAVSETFYIILSLITLLVLEKLGISVISIVLVLAMLVLAYFFLKTASRSIYAKAYNKKELMNVKFKEDGAAIKKSLNIQYLLFMVIAFTCFTTDSFQIFYIIIMALANIFTYIKYFLQLKKERNAKKA